MAGIELIEAVAGQKNKASNYNENFNRIKNYVINSIETLESETQQTLSIYQDINSLATSGQITLYPDTINSVAPLEEITFTISGPAASERNKYHQILVQIYLTDTNFLTADNNGLGTNYYFNEEKPRFTYTGYYDLIYSYDSIKNKWCVGAIYKGEVA